MVYDLDIGCGHLKIAVLKNQPWSQTTKLIVRHLKQSYVDVDIYHAYAEKLPDIEEYDAIIGSGSTYNVKHVREKQWFVDEMELYRNAAEVDKPVLGVCFSHQAIAEAFGGLSDKATNYSYAYGPNDVHVDTKSPLFQGLCEDIKVAESHGYEVVEVPEEFEVTASSELCEVEAMKMIGKPIYSTQFHPEWHTLMEEYGETNEAGFHILGNFLKIAYKEKSKKLPLSDNNIYI